jgi:hypothetical protein
MEDCFDLSTNSGLTIAGVIVASRVVVLALDMMGAQSGHAKRVADVLGTLLGGKRKRFDDGE